jgi:type II secretory pathway component PulF
MKFSYQAYDKSGSLKTGVVEAAGVDEASEQVRRRGSL